jgi:hypothetical protein
MGEYHRGGQAAAGRVLFLRFSRSLRPRAIWARWSILSSRWPPGPTGASSNTEHNGTLVTVTPSVKGRATIHDKDILIFCISQLMAAINAGREVSRTLHLTAHDLLTATRRDTSGDGYRRLRDAFERLAGTRITTNIATGGVEVTHGFGLIESLDDRAPTRAGAWSRSLSRSRNGSTARRLSKAF